MHAEPVSAAKMGAEAVFRNAVSVVAAARVPGAMLTPPIVRTLALPDVLPSRPRPAHLTYVCRVMPAVRLMVGPSVDCFMEFASLLTPVFWPIAVVALLRRGCMPVFVVTVPSLPVRTTLVTLRPAVLCAGQDGRSQEQSQY
jgi:hypothetical protein